MAGYTLEPANEQPQQPNYTLTPADDEQPQVPESFLHRVAAGYMTGLHKVEEFGVPQVAENLKGGAEQFIEGLSQTVGAEKPEPLPQWLEQISQAQPQNRASNERFAQFVMGAGNVLGGIYNMAASPLGLATGPLQEATGGPEGPFPAEATQNAIGLIAPAVAGMPAKFMRMRNGVPQVIGELPKVQDFSTGAKVLDSAAAEQNLRDLWQERGIHPAEAVHDAQSDALLKQQIAPPSISAFHGSPYNFDQFSVKKSLSPPEGMNFTQDEEIAKHYAGEGGTVYRVQLNIDSNHILNWDKPLSEQSEQVKQALAPLDKNMNDSSSVGEHLFGLGDPTRIRDLGISGIQYQGEGGQLIVFDDSKIQITHKNGVPLTKTETAPVRGTPMPEGTPRSELARTGEAHIDNILESPVTQRAIDNAVVDRQYTVPYTAGGSTPLEDPTMFIDRRFPQSFTIDGVTFDPAEPFAIHENVEQHVMELLIKGGMSAQEAYRVAHFEFAEKAEGAWYRSHGIDQEKAEAAYAPYMAAIQHNMPSSVKGFHGTDQEFTEPSVRFGGTRGKVPDERGTVFFSSKREFAELYGKNVIERQIALGKTDTFDVAKLINDPDFVEQMHQSFIRTATRTDALKQRAVDDPSFIDKAWQNVLSKIEEWKETGHVRYNNALTGAIASIARERGLDTAVIKNMAEGHGKASDQYLVLNDQTLTGQPGIPPNLYVKPYPHDNPSAAQAEPIAEPKPSAEEIAQAKAILAAQEPREGIGGAPVGAAVTPPSSLPSLAAQPPRPAGSLAAKGKAAVDQALGLAKNVQGLLDPMATGSKEAMVIAKDAMNSVRRIRWEHAQIDNELMNSPQLKAARDRTGETIWEQHERMWNAADEESVMQQEAKLGGPAPSPHMGLGTLEPEERTYIDLLHQRAQVAWLHAVDADMVEGDGLPAYTPRMVMNVSALTDAVGPQVLNELGRNVFTRTAQMLHREYLTAEETEAAAKELVVRRMGERGASQAEIEAAEEKVKIGRSIRALPLATARLEEAVIWRQMINNIEDVGKAAGQPAVAYGHQPPGWFTIAGSPAFSRWRPALEQDPISGKWVARTDDTGRTLMERQPIYLPNEFRGPMKSILDPGSSLLDPSKPSPYGILMALKGKAMTAILNSPLIHNEVVWSKVAEAAGGREWMGFGLYWRGNKIVNGWQQTGRATELIERGLAPIGPRGPVQDITGMMEEPNMAPGRSLTAKVLGFVPGLFDEGAGTAVKAAIDKAGDFVHNTLLWDRVRDLQFGLADHLSDRLVAKGVDRLTADRFASHFSNIVVGSIPKEAMSGGAQATANIMLFSRSFTLGNLATFKQAVAGMPAPLVAQIERDLGMAGKTPDEIEKLQSSAKWMARKKAISTIAISAGLYYVGNAVIQHAFNMIHGASVEDEVEGYARRYRDAMNEISKNPFELRNLIARLSPTYDNEPAKQDRAYVGQAADGTAIYARNPTGKYGEEMVGYPTMPLSMLKRKLSPFVGGLADLYQNDEFGGAFDTKRPIYDPNANDFQIGIAVAKHLVEKHLPMGQIKGAADLLSGEGDQEVNALRLIAPALGFTVSEGAPGGPQKGEFYAAKSAADMKFNMAWPDIKRQIQSGDVDGGRKLLEQLGKSPMEIRGLIRSAVNPSAPVHGRTLQNFYRYATPEQRERFERQQQRPQP